MTESWPETNMRRLKRVQTEAGIAFTLETERERAKNNLLCDYCAWKREAPGYPACSIFEQVREVQKKGAVPMIRVCAQYQPVITFQKTGGLEGRFNTFRLGVAWFNRLTPGVVVGMANAKDDAIFGKARVIEVIHGPYEEMIDKHAYKNHLLVGLEPEDAAAKMKEIIPKSYGPLVVARASVLSVIYLQNLSMGSAT